jgi:hypothetical protein
MGAMKAIYTDIQELQNAALGDEDSFIQYIEETGWLSPTEIEILRKRAESVDLTATSGQSANVAHPNAA